MAYPVVPLIPAGNESLVSSAILQNAATADGTGTDYDITGMATVQALIKPVAYTGTITFYISIDGVTFVKILGNQVDTTTIADNVANPASTASLWTFQTGGAIRFRAALTSSGGTSVTVTAAASPVANSCPLGVTLSSAVLAAGTAVIGSAMIQTTSGVPLTADQTNSILRSSLYVKKSAAADTALTLGGATAANSVPVVLPTDQFSVAGADGLTATNVQEVAIGRFNGATVDQLRTFTKMVLLDEQAVTTDTPVDVLTPTTGKKFRIIAYHLINSAATAGAIQIQSVSGTNLIVAPSGSPSPDLGAGIVADAINHHMFIDATQTGAISGWIGYSEE